MPTDADPDPAPSTSRSPEGTEQPDLPLDDSPLDIQHLVQPAEALPPLQLADLPDPLRQAALHAGWKELTPVQQYAIPYMLAGRDLMVQSRTGSGKTGAFLLPMLDRIDFTRPKCQALVLVPTRELAQQVTREAQLLSQSAGLRTIAVYGGVGYGAQLDAFRDGAHLVVGTPGRVLDHLLRGSLKLDQLRFLVFDEADRMLGMGFYPDMKEVERYLPARREGYMFSATFPLSVQRLAHQFLNQPGFLSLSRDNVHVTDMDHIYYVVPPMEKDRCLVRLLEIENPGAAMIFCNTRTRVNYVTAVLRRFGYDVDQITSELTQVARENVLARIKRRQLRFLVATDVAARGIDIPHLTHVFLYEVPEETELYIHRAGRTARAGASGVAISLVSSLEELDLRRIATRFKIELEKRPMPTEEQYNEIVAQRLVALLESRLRHRDRLQVERMRRMLPLARALSETDDELALLAMLLDDAYQDLLHAPPELPPPEKDADEPKAGKRRRSRSRGKGKAPAGPGEAAAAEPQAAPSPPPERRQPDAPPTDAPAERKPGARRRVVRRREQSD
ncbi:MAG TPA: DEAD/DEAH box helicase [Candidatus Sumerlaeota bacterium]|nr:DEAD/DEAH box helicase [Candidatus Sumerlaeota bacterium]HPK01351.1 DEAD/DEAH box helicase [Candidatus Sumerlaeota bacterium]